MFLIQTSHVEKGIKLFYVCAAGSTRSDILDRIVGDNSGIGSAMHFLCLKFHVENIAVTFWCSKVLMSRFYLINK